MRASAAPVTRGAAGGAPQPAEAAYFLAPFKDMPLKDPGIRAASFAAVPGRRDAVKFTVAVRAAAPLAVWEAPGLAGRFSESAVTVVACEPREVVFYSAGGAAVAPQRLQEELRISSLWDHQRF